LIGAKMADESDVLLAAFAKTTAVSWRLLSQVVSTGCGKKSRPQKVFAVFSPTVWNFILKFYTFFC